MLCVTLTIAGLGLAGCATGLECDASHRPDAGSDVTPHDTAPTRDVPLADATIDAPLDAAAPDVPTAPPDAPAPPPDAPVARPDVVPDSAPPLPVSCRRTGAPDCSPSSAMGRCPDGPSVFTRDVNAAIDAVLAEHPAWFVTAGYPSCCPLIQPAHVGDYMQAVSDHLAAAGLCASGPGDEVGVKYNNECSESWDLVANPDAATNLVRRHYVGNCFPSFF